MAKVKLLVNTTIRFAKDSTVEVTEGEAKRLSSLGFAVRLADKAEPVQEEKAEEAPKEATEKKPVPKKKAGRPKKKEA